MAVFSTLVAIGLHAYLAWTYYPLKYARSTGESLCNLNATFNCDAVAASSFSSFLNIPMAIWGLTTNIVFLIALLIYALRLTDERERAWRNVFYLSSFIALTSIFMAAISLFLINSFCLFCIGTYICSFVTLIALFPTGEFSFALLLADVKSIWIKNKNFVFLMASIPIFSFVIHQSMVRQYGAEKIQKVVETSINEWMQNPKNELNTLPSLSYGPERDQAKLVISEFADFLCGHCKHAAPSLDAFAKSHKDIRFEFYSFALDGECNDAVERKVGTPCTLAKAVYCAEKQHKGWELHDLAFKNQTDFYSARSTSDTIEKLKNLSSKLIDNWTELQTCIESEEALNSIRAQGKTG
ncbi:MAG: DsbA family protein, partial [Bdellovibrionales bacterium]|nr:DsbA family protein [Bdellovibrionales bacterium]